MLQSVIIIIQIHVTRIRVNQVGLHGQEPVAPAVRRNPPKLQSSFACPPIVGSVQEDTRIPPSSGDGGFLRRRVNIHAKRKGKQKWSIIFRVFLVSCFRDRLLVSFSIHYSTILKAWVSRNCSHTFCMIKAESSPSWRSFFPDTNEQEAISSLFLKNRPKRFSICFPSLRCSDTRSSSVMFVILVLSLKVSS